MSKAKKEAEVLKEVYEIIELFFDDKHYYKYCIRHAERMVIESCDTPTMMFHNKVLTILKDK